jgi:hypothetical protein
MESTTVSFVIAAARGGVRNPLLSKPGAPTLRSWRHLSLGVAWAASGCTLTADSFEPLPAGRAVAESAPAVSGLLPLPSEEPLGDSLAPIGTSAGEGVDPRGPLESGETSDGRTGGSSQEAEEAAAALGDAGAARDVATDAGGPPAPRAPCPSEAFAASCYEFFDDPVSWNIAEQRCVDWGGYLASVESSEENAFLDGWPGVMGIAAADGSGIWLGGTDAGGEGDFRWRDGVPLGFVSWAPNQPDNGAGVDCIEKRNDGTASWYDRRCTDQQRYVCERPL